MATTEDAHDVPRQPLGDRLVWYFVRLLRIDEKAAAAVRQWLEGRREDR
jgi:hypothetical protein